MCYRNSVECSILFSQVETVNITNAKHLRHLEVIIKHILKEYSYNDQYIFNPATSLCLSQARTWISNAKWRGVFLSSMVVVRFVNIVGMVKH